jgi:protocatechuate 3,4-dioxygenase beta subunit
VTGTHQRSTEFGSIAGRVVDAAGKPVEGASVAVTGSVTPHRDIAAITNADGRFHFGSMQPGPYRLAARARGSQQSADVVVAAGTEAHVDLRLGG